jgi:hypothetical protein
VSDESLRSLARAVEAGDGPAARLRYARALERAERRDEALDVLASTRHKDASVRTALSGYPSWGQTDGDAGRTRYLDLAPIRREPHLRWIMLALDMNVRHPASRGAASNRSRVAC